MTHQIVAPNYIFKIHASIAVCPYCGGALTVQSEEWVQLDDGTFALEEGLAHADCMNEPDIDENTDVGRKAWRAWNSQHSYMPYVYQLPVDIKCTQWINENYRFAVEESR